MDKIIGQFRTSLMRSFVNLQTQDLGFDADRVLHARLPLPRVSYASGSAKRQSFDQVLSRVQALPGVASATVTSSIPPFGGIRTEVEVPGRTHEIGSRMALGAARADVLRSVVGGGLRLVGSGVALGLLASLAATRVLSRQLFGVAPRDPRLVRYPSPRWLI